MPVTLPGTGEDVASRTTTAGEVQAMQIDIGTGTTSSPVTAGNPLPTVDSAANALTGATNESAAASDTATSGLNGLLKRIAQRLTSVLAAIPAALTGSGNFKAALVESTATVTTQQRSASTSAVTRVTSSTSATTLLAANANRLKWAVFNDSAAILKLKCGASPTSTSFTFEVPPAYLYEEPAGLNYTGIITGLWVSADGAANVTEFTP